MHVAKSNCLQQDNTHTCRVVSTFLKMHKKLTSNIWEKWPELYQPPPPSHTNWANPAVQATSCTYVCIHYGHVLGNLRSNVIGSFTSHGTDFLRWITAWTLRWAFWHCYTREYHSHVSYQRYQIFKIFWRKKNQLLYLSAVRLNCMEDVLIHIHVKMNECVKWTENARHSCIMTHISF